MSNLLFLMQRNRQQHKQEGGLHTVKSLSFSKEHMCLDSSKLLNPLARKFYGVLWNQRNTMHSMHVLTLLQRLGRIIK
jgi:hypothetical protein